MSSLTIKDISKRFGAYQALDGVNIEADSGEFLVLLGPSGCGKSTLLNMIAGLETVTEGLIRIDGEVVNERDPKDRLDPHYPIVARDHVIKHSQRPSVDEVNRIAGFAERD